jgi:hypothetical protein
MQRLSRRPTSALRTSLAFGLALLALTGAAPVSAGAQGRFTPPSALIEASGQGTVSLETAAAKASETGRKIAMSLIALGFSIAAITLGFRRDFKEAVGVFAIGVLAILLATPAGVNVLHDTVNTLFGSS